MTIGKKFISIRECVTPFALCNIRKVCNSRNEKYYLLPRDFILFKLGFK